MVSFNELEALAASSDESVAESPVEERDAPMDALEAALDESDDGSSGARGDGDARAALKAALDDDDDDEYEDDDDEAPVKRRRGEGGDVLRQLEAAIAGGDDDDDDGDGDDDDDDDEARGDDEDDEEEDDGFKPLETFQTAMRARKTGGKVDELSAQLRQINCDEFTALESLLEEDDDDDDDDGSAAMEAVRGDAAAAVEAAADGEAAAAAAAFEKRPNGPDCSWAAESPFGQTLASTLSQFIAEGEITEEEAMGIFTHFEKTFDEALREAPDCLLPMRKDRKAAAKKGVKAAPSCELTGNIESRNRVDGHVHLVLNDVVLTEPTEGKQVRNIDVGRCELVLADQSEFEPFDDPLPTTAGLFPDSDDDDGPPPAPRAEEAPMEELL